MEKILEKVQEIYPDAILEDEGIYFENMCIISGLFYSLCSFSRNSFYPVEEISLNELCSSVNINDILKVIKSIKECSEQVINHFQKHNK